MGENGCQGKPAVRIRDVLKHLSARQDQGKICMDELVKISALPLDEYDYSQIAITSIKDW